MPDNRELPLHASLSGWLHPALEAQPTSANDATRSRDELTRIFHQPAPQYQFQA
jgi:hypothetical protein